MRLHRAPNRSQSFASPRIGNPPGKGYPYLDIPDSWIGRRTVVEREYPEYAEKLSKTKQDPSGPSPRRWLRRKVANSPDEARKSDLSHRIGTASRMVVWSPVAVVALTIALITFRKDPRLTVTGGDAPAQNGELAPDYASSGGPGDRRSPPKCPPCRHPTPRFPHRDLRCR